MSRRDRVGGPTNDELAQLLRLTRAELVLRQRQSEPRRSSRLWKGISAGVLIDAGVSVERGRTRLPYRLRDGRELYAKIVLDSGRCWYEPPPTETGGLIPFGLETLPSRTAYLSTLFVCEGESDALALREAFEPPFCSIALPGAGTWRAAWRSYLEPHPTIYLLGDGDDAGRRMNWAIKRDVPSARPVRLPAGDDARSLLQRCGAGALELYLDAADCDALIAAALRSGPDLETFERLARRREI